MNVEGTQKRGRKTHIADTYKHKHSKYRGAVSQHLYMCLHIQIECDPLHVSASCFIAPLDVQLQCIFKKIILLLGLYVFVSGTYYIPVVGIYDT